MMILDDCITQEYQDHIKTTLTSGSFPWFYLSDITGGKNNLSNQQRPGMVHFFASKSVRNSNFYPMILPIVEAAEKKLNKKFSEIISAKTFMQLPLSKEIVGRNMIDTFHIDLKINHTVILYYVFDSDGKTILTDREYEYGMPETMDVSDSYKIIKRVSPKQGRILTFDGKHYHTAMQPRKNVRCVININVV